MNPIKFIFCCLTPLASFSQSPDSLSSLVKSEASFAMAARNSSTRQAFLSYLSDSGIVFRPGPVAGKKVWKSSAERKDLLSWRPVFADIAQSDDLGYTTGPWEYFAARADSQSAGQGYFVSVWKQEEHQWKLILDIGIETPGASGESANFPKYESGRNADPKKILPTDRFVEIEKGFIADLEKDPVTAYSGVLGSEARLYRPGMQPLLRAAEQRAVIAIEGHLHLNLLGWACSKAGDLAYVYGEVNGISRQKGRDVPFKAHYVRIWKKGSKSGWQLVLDLRGATEKNQ